MQPVPLRAAGPNIRGECEPGPLTQEVNKMRGGPSRG